MGHRKGGYDVAVDDYIMCMVTTLVLNLPYNFTKMVFEHMKLNTTGKKFLKYPRFIQMIRDDKIKNLAREDDDELPHEHMKNATLDRLQVYKSKDVPPVRHKFGCLRSPDYLPLQEEKWRHDDSDSENLDR
ncbi:hypothetical protein Hanom_Chr03g00205241 [Helianthus anomalus]